MCVEYLAAILARLAPEFRPMHCYEGGGLRIIAIAPSFENLLAEPFDQIRRGAEGNVSVMTRMFGTRQTIASLTTCPHCRRTHCEKMQWIGELADRSIESAHDRVLVARGLTDAYETLETTPALCTGNSQE